MKPVLRGTFTSGTERHAGTEDGDAEGDGAGEVDDGSGSRRDEMGRVKVLWRGMDQFRDEAEGAPARISSFGIVV